MTTLTLEELIRELEKYPRDHKVPLGFGEPHSWRGDYAQIAFRPVRDTTAGEMLDVAKSALDGTFTGWKGGQYTMDKSTECYLAEDGTCGEGLGKIFLALMMGEDPKDIVLTGWY